MSYLVLSVWSLWSYGSWYYFSYGTDDADDHTKAFLDLRDYESVSVSYAILGMYSGFASSALSLNGLVGTAELDNSSH